MKQAARMTDGWRIQHSGFPLSRSWRSEVQDGSGREQGTSAMETLGALLRHDQSGIFDAPRGDVEIIHFAGDYLGTGTDGELVIRPRREIGRWRCQDWDGLPKKVNPDSIKERLLYRIGFRKTSKQRVQAQVQIEAAPKCRIVFESQSPGRLQRDFKFLLEDKPDVSGKKTAATVYTRELTPERYREFFEKLKRPVEKEWVCATKPVRRVTASGLPVWVSIFTYRVLSGSHKGEERQIARIVGKGNEKPLRLYISGKKLTVCKAPGELPNADELKNRLDEIRDEEKTR